MPGHLITGATGFVGGALALKLLERTDDPVVCLVRGNGAPPEARLETALRESAAAYAYPAKFIDANHSRIHVLPGSLDESAERAAPVGVRISHFWHAAASLRYDDRSRAEIFSTNVGGTRQAIGLALRLGVESFNHVSTAYVAGRRTGPIEESHVASDAEANNLYEQSKMDGERLVAAARGMRTRILRPSIVVGHSQTLAATRFSGMYRMMKEFVRFRAVAWKSGGLSGAANDLKVMADPGSTLNFIPVDYVVEQAVELCLAGIDEEVVHLTNELSPTVERCFGLFFDELGMRRPAYVNSKEQLSGRDAALERKLAFYVSYLSGAKQFRQQAGRKYGRTLSFEFDDQTLLRYFRWYLRHLGAAKSVNQV